ncbi:histidine phosphatase family protein [Paracoccus jiaweipingae]|uniref:histidine phosphatase family protein n=1 Tax=unclassified Paracoccus (in: a-proteobacteria) TaxID=2688777 RepID=UPI00378EBB01
MTPDAARTPATPPPDPLPADARLWLIRHAPQIHGGRLAGRRDVAADLSDGAALTRLRAALPLAAPCWTSPARRCLTTARALGLAPRLQPLLWEQDFGAWEGIPFQDLPDIGRLPLPELAAHRPPGGESFHDMAARVQPQLARASGEVIVTAHAGTVRAALAWVAGDAALGFAVAPLSLTILRRDHGIWSVEAVNRLP